MTEFILARRDKGRMTEKTRQGLIGDLRNHIVACNLAIKREKAGKLPACFVNEFLRGKIMKAEEILKKLYERDNL